MSYDPYLPSADSKLLSEAYKAVPGNTISMNHSLILPHPPRAEGARRVLNGSKLRWAP